MKHLPLFLALPLAWSALGPGAAPDFDDAFGSISEDSIEQSLEYMASQPLEGRDSPSVGLSMTAHWIADRFAEYGLEPAADSRQVFDSKKSSYRPWLPDDGEGGKEEGATEGAAEGEAGRSTAEKKGVYLRPWTRPLVAPVRDGCSLAMEDEEFLYGQDFVPLGTADGKASGELIYVGFGAESRRDKYDDLAGLDLEGKIAVLFEGEPRSKRGFGGPEETTEAATLWDKLTRLQSKDVAGCLVIRRAPAARGRSRNADPVPLAYRFTVAEFAGERRQDPPPRRLPPTLVISEEAASRLLGKDASKAAAKSDKTGKPSRIKIKGRSASFESKTQLQDCVHDNVVGIVRGTDPELAKDYIVIGAHYDHIGAGIRGRIGYGADDNGSGTSALLELARAVSISPPRRSVCFVAFSAEEDGLLGSKAFCRKLPFEREDLVFMLNLDMIGRGPDTEVIVLGLVPNPSLSRTLDMALSLKRTGIREYSNCKDMSLFTRSDHHSFHEILGCATLFFFENYPVDRNPDYHTWRDLPESVSVKKIANTARLAYNTLWIVGNDDEAPARAKR